MCKLGVISPERLKIEVKSYVPRRLVQQRMTLSDLEWPFRGSSVPSVLEGACIVIIRCTLARISLYGWVVQ